jgi:hypothetical protein
MLAAPGVFGNVLPFMRYNIQSQKRYSWAFRYIVVLVILSAAKNLRRAACDAGACGEPGA